MVQERASYRLAPVLILFGTLGGWGAGAWSAAGSESTRVPRLNGFELQHASIPLESILPGGTPRDGIPALDAPGALPAREAPWHADEAVIGVVLGGEARAYPIAVLHRHELVNDTLGGRGLLVWYCPLCGTGIVFDSSADGSRRSFGASGLLYESDPLLYDRETGSLWSQTAGEAVTGPATGTRLPVLRSQHLSWGEWKKRHPETTVLGRSPAVGHGPDRSSEISGKETNR